MSLNDWCDVVTHVLDLQLPWRTLKSRLVDIDANGLVLYESTFRTQELQFALNTNVINVSFTTNIFEDWLLMFFVEARKPLSNNLSK